VSGCVAEEVRQAWAAASRPALLHGSSLQALQQFWRGGGRAIDTRQLRGLYE
jgi:hypothetical protein